MTTSTRRKVNVRSDEPTMELVDEHRSGGARSDPRRWKALGVLALVQFMLVLDVTVVNVALPRIQTELGFSRAGLAWVVDGYVLMAGGMLLLGGRLGDLLGRRRMFLVGVTLFAAASAASGAAMAPGMLVASRFAQGVGDALAAPAAFGLIALLFTEPAERARAIGVFGGVAGLGGTLGPVLSGLLVQDVSWRWIFFINIPVAVFAFVAVRRLVSESKATPVVTAVGSPKSRPDVAGALLATTGLVGLVYGFLAAANHPWASSTVVGPLVAGGTLLTAFVLRERTATAPLVPANFLHNRTRVAANVATLFFTCVFFTVFFLMTLYWEQVRHYSALQTGVAYLPLGIGISVGIAVASALVPKVGVRVLLVSGSVVFAAGVALASRLTPDSAYVTGPLVGLVLLAFGAGISFAAFGNASMHDVSEQDASLASGVQNTVQQAGGAVGLAVLATLALRHATSGVAHGVAPAVASTQGTVLAFRVGAVVALAGGLVVAAMLRRGLPDSIPARDDEDEVLGLDVA